MIVCFLALLKVLQSWHHKRHRDNHSASQPSASDTQLSALLAGGGCSPQLTNVDDLPHTGQVGGGCPPQLTNVDDLPHTGQVGGGCPPQLTNVDDLPHTGQVGGGCPPQLTNVDDLPHPGQVGGGCPPQLTNVDDLPHPGQLKCVKAWEVWPRSCKLLNCSQMPKAYCFAYETW